MQLPLAYKDAAAVLKNLCNKKGSVNSLISQIDHQTNTKLVYALVIKFLKHANVIKDVIEKSKLNLEFDPFLGQILVTDLLFGKGLSTNQINEVYQAKKILEHEKELRKLLAERVSEVKRAKSKTKIRGVKEVTEDEFLVRYVRVNLIKTTLKKVISIIKKKGFEQIEYAAEEKFSRFKKIAKKLSENQFVIDYHFKKDLLVFNTSATHNLKQLELFENGKIIFQDKASLIAVESLALKPGMTVLDVCCAPGMKTSAIASRLQNNAKIISIDMNENRLNEMDDILKKCGVDCCQVYKNDFTKVDPGEVGKVDVILLDPSCSGSGMKRRLNYAEDSVDKKRLYKLASFQTKMLCHAMSFNVQRIVYSTCSLSVIENEFVIKSALEESPDKFSYKVADVFKEWETRGLGNFKFASKCLRSDAKNLTNGFFVCCLERI